MLSVFLALAALPYFIPTISASDAAPLPPGYSIPVVDLAAKPNTQIVVDREQGQYLGHVTSVLLKNGHTVISVYPKGHGRGSIVMKRSEDGGKIWGERLPVPANWATSQEVPTIFPTIDAHGKRRLVIFSGLYPIKEAISEDEGKTWTELRPIGNFGGIVAMSCMERLKNGDYLCMFHDDGRYFREHSKPEKPVVFTLFQTLSHDGGLTWDEPIPIFHSSDVHLCEPGLIRSPDGNKLAVLLRENSRRRNSYVIFSDDEGKTWSAPRELPGALTGDRHTAAYSPDGRLMITFRDTTRESVTKGDWVCWVGHFDDIVNGAEGDYRVRLGKNTYGADCAYPGVVVLKDGTFVLSTYGHWEEGEQPYIICVRFKLKDTDTLLKKKRLVK